MHALVLDATLHVSLGIDAGISIAVPFLTGTGSTTMVSSTPSVVLLLSGIGIAMHSVATYAHTYMGYECYSMSFSLELLLFMGVMLCYIVTASMYAIIVG